MRRSTAGRTTVLALVAAALAVGGAGPAGAVTATVATGPELAAAFVDPLVDRIELAADIDVTCADESFRDPLAPTVTIDGGGRTITDLCTEIEATTFWGGAIDLEDIEIVGPAAPASGAILRGWDVHVTGARLVSRGAEAALIFTSGDVVDTVIELEGGNAVRGTASGGGLLLDRVTITGTGDGVEWDMSDPALDRVTVRDSTIATTGSPLRAAGPALVERSSFRNGFGSAIFSGPALITASTFALDPALDRPGLPLTAAIWVPSGADVVLQQSTVLSLADDPADSPESLRVDVDGRLTLAGTAIGIGPGSVARACLDEGTIVSEGGNVVVDDTCPQVASDQVVDDLGLEPYDRATGVAPPLAASPVLDVVPACRSDQDQLGQPRPSGTACDAGAVERQVATPPTTSTTSTVPGGGSGPAAPATPVVGPARFTG